MSAQERLDLGMSYLEEGRFDEAIAVLKTISSSEDPEIYARALLGIGVAYQTLGKLKKAIKAWSKVRRDENSEAYAKAQFNLGVIYQTLGKLKKAIKAWSNVPHSNNSDAYAKAQLNLGAAYHTLGKLDEAIKAWSKVLSDENFKAYAKAQSNLGAAHHTLGKLKKAIKAWSKVLSDENSEVYAWAQFGIGVAYKDQGKLEEAIDTWLKVDSNHSPEAYVEAQLGLGEVYSLDKEKEELAYEAYDNVRDFSYYKSERGFKILKCFVEVREDLHTLAKNTDKILKSLQIIPGFEPTVAHYTRPQIAFDLFEGKKNDNDKEPSNFRLSTIRGVNDPTEGLILGKYWTQQGISETIHINDTATFISCFTFNHDSLNQFRLYGKENGREATGVSLVFNKEFFSEQSDALEFIAVPSTAPSSKSKQIKPNKTGKIESDNKKTLIGKSTLYRCIYLDPETGYLTLARLDKSTFYHQHKEYEWEAYYELISNQEENIKKYLSGENDKDSKNKSIPSILQSIFTESRSYNKEEKQQILETVQFILLPLQYLVKHIAFQEEQECRIMYITHLHDEKIHHYWEKQQVYVEYEEPVLPHIDEIYLSPGAAKYQDHFRILLDQDGNKSKVRISQNPFRNKE